MKTPPTRFQAESAKSQGGFYINENSPETQKARILVHLKSGRSLTALEAFEMGFGMRLAAVIHYLRLAGYPVTKEMVKVGRGKKVARYSLPSGQ